MQSFQHVQLDSERCRGCELCLDVCPNALFQHGEVPNAQGHVPMVMPRPEYCINCMKCVQICPDQAFDVPDKLDLNWPGYVFGASLRWHRFWSRHDR